MNTITLISENSASIVKIDKGELVSYIKNNEELIHQKGTPGWRNADTEMFPIIGPTDATSFEVSTPKGTCIQDQHGLLRELNYTLINSSDKSAVYQKIYQANTEVKNTKFPEKSPKEVVFWPYDFSFKKSFELTNTALKITFEIAAEKGMPFMLGYHPAFKLSGDFSEICKSENQRVTLQKIMDGGNTAYPILNSKHITLTKKTGTISIKTTGFKGFMFWTEVPTMLCMEPITAYPYTGGEMLSKELFNSSNGIDVFEVLITPY
ncbi:aldose 1-epimerase [Lutibacter sp.]|uniref:aldose epimerase family protein n=1 Tax=Lutibacter sp. TaxID=1925666 RepID=UPI001A2F1C7B|nr:aldose 1-epimerase [Lutibacter sp.]MBI9041168.1 aldose 1-epimerase [Lutibacter sp.]